MPFSPAPLLAALVLLLILAILLQNWQGHCSESIGKDARQNLDYAINLWQHGIYGVSADRVLPGYQREPFPNWILAGHIRWLVRPGSAIRLQELIANSDLLSKTTRVNFLYFFGLLLSLWGLCLRLIKPAWLANIAAMLVIIFSADSFASEELNNLNTELPASFLLTLASFFLVLTRQKHKRRWAVLAGAVFGCLVLTKAAGAYLAFVLLPVLLLFLSRCRRQSMVLALCVALGFALPVLPWIGRNLIAFRVLAISEGGGRFCCIERLTIK